jgi:hypothetical protein
MTKNITAQTGRNARQEVKTMQIQPTAVFRKAHEGYIVFIICPHP